MGAEPVAKRRRVDHDESGSRSLPHALDDGAGAAPSSEGGVRSDGMASANAGNTDCGITGGDCTIVLWSEVRGRNFYFDSRTQVGSWEPPLGPLTRGSSAGALEPA